MTQKSSEPRDIRLKRLKIRSWHRGTQEMDLLLGRWWELAAAVGAIFIIVLAWNIFGDRLRDALDPKLRNA